MWCHIVLNRVFGEPLSVTSYPSSVWLFSSSHRPKFNKFDKDVVSSLENENRFCSFTAGLKIASWIRLELLLLLLFGLLLNATTFENFFSEIVWYKWSRFDAEVCVGNHKVQNIVKTILNSQTLLFTQLTVPVAADNDDSFCACLFVTH